MEKNRKNLDHLIQPPNSQNGQILQDNRSNSQKNVAENPFNISVLDDLIQKELGPYFNQFRLSKRYKQVKRWLSSEYTLSSLLDLEFTQQNMQIVQSSFKRQVQNKPSRRRSKTFIKNLAKKGSKCIAIISCRPVLRPQQNAYDIVMIGHGKVLYYVAECRKWQELLLKIQEIKALDVEVLLEAKQTLLHMGMHHSCRISLSAHQDLHAFLQQSTKQPNSLQGKQQEKSKNKTCQLISYARRYMHVRDILLANLRKGRALDILTLEESKMLIFVLNILMQYSLKTPGIQVSDFIQKNRKKILQCFMVYLRTFHKRVKLNNNKKHFPGKLGNSYLCRSCKKDRGYIYCPTCTKIQDQIVALCLDCYDRYHQNLIVEEIQEQSQKQIYNQWSIQEFQVRRIIDETIQIDISEAHFNQWHYYHNQLVKKQQQNDHMYLQIAYQNHQYEESGQQQEQQEEEQYMVKQQASNNNDYIRQQSQ